MLPAVVDVRVGRAIDLLPGLEADEKFDLVFIDADKPSNPAYLAGALALTRPGSVIVGDNVVRGGSVVDTATGIEIMALFEKLHQRGNTIILVTHEHDIAMHAHRVVFIRDGKIERDEQIKK